MDAQLKAKWIEALRSGDYCQTHGELANEAFTELCCIGVGYKVCVGSPDVLDGFPDDRTLNASKALGIEDHERAELVYLNDTQRLPFSRIADWIEANIPAAPQDAERNGAAG